MPTNVPPPRRPPVIEYHQPRRDERGLVNLRWEDNLFQLVAGIIGAVIGGISGSALAAHSGNDFSAMFFGGIAGLLAGVFGWGLYLGIYYRIRAGGRNRGI